MATRLVEAGQDEHEIIMGKITINYKHAGKRKILNLHKNADLDKAMQQNLSKLCVIFIPLKWRT